MSDIRDVAFISTEEDLMILDAVAQVTMYGNYHVVSYCVGTRLSSLDLDMHENLILWSRMPKPVKLKKKYGWGKNKVPNQIPKR